MNLPLCVIAIVIVWFFLRLKVPQDDLYSKFQRMDWIGNVLIIVSITFTSVTLTWAGFEYAWSSCQVIVPLILSVVLMAIFFVYEAKFAVEPVVAWELVNKRTSALG
jgi:Trk-type K+ transport system membrane component